MFIVHSLILHCIHPPPGLPESAILPFTFLIVYFIEYAGRGWYSLRITITFTFKLSSFLQFQLYTHNFTTDYD